MNEFVKDLLLSFIPIFVAVDAFGVLPVYISLAGSLDHAVQKKIIVQSMITALCLALGFIFVGQAIFRFLGITVGDFMVAGGVVLFSIAIMDIVNPRQRKKIPHEEMGVVPLGTPLIAGPAVLTTTLLCVSEFGMLPTIISVIVNIAIAGIVFGGSRWLGRILGDPGSKALSKVTSLFLAAIAVMMVRKGLVFLISINH
ncbi:MAG: MarC family protein [Spirochaetes bacterium]|nr:MAG: MarC family protein [Spirochaetota bacterium]